MGVWSTQPKSPPDPGFIATVIVKLVTFSVLVVWHQGWELERDAEGACWPVQGAPLVRPARASGTVGAPVHLTAEPVQSESGEEGMASVALQAWSKLCLP